MCSCLFFITCFFSTVFLTSSTRFEFFVNPVSIIKEKGYPSEKYTVQTEDGYLISLYRIPHGLKSSKPNTRPILLNHGLSASAGDFLTLKRSPGYVLADHGYDVWLMTARGASFSDRHISIDESDKRRFYNFSWHEIGVYDVPACIDFILQKTGQKQIQYLGHSQGGTAFLVMGAIRPEYNSKISLATLMGATSIINNVNLGIKLMSLFYDFFISLPDTLGIYDIPYIHFIRVILQRICINDRYRDGCAALFDLVGGYPHHSQLDAEVFHNMFKTLPSNFALKQMIHYLQCVRFGTFRLFDYGKEANLVHYGSNVPPDYNISKIFAPISIIYAQNDHLASLKDSHYLVNNLKNIVSFKIIKDECWNHGDFIFGIDAMKIVYVDMLKIMSMY